MPDYARLLEVAKALSTFERAIDEDLTKLTQPDQVYDTSEIVLGVFEGCASALQHCADMLADWKGIKSGSRIFLWPGYLSVNGELSDRRVLVRKESENRTIFGGFSGGSGGKTVEICEQVFTDLLAHSIGGLHQPSTNSWIGSQDHIKILAVSVGPATVSETENVDEMIKSIKLSRSSWPYWGTEIASKLNAQSENSKNAALWPHLAGLSYDERMQDKDQGIYELMYSVWIAACLGGRDPANTEMCDEFWRRFNTLPQSANVWAVNSALESSISALAESDSDGLPPYRAWYTFRTRKVVEVPGAPGSAAIGSMMLLSSVEWPTEWLLLIAEWFDAVLARVRMAESVRLIASLQSEAAFESDSHELNAVVGVLRLGSFAIPIDLETLKLAPPPPRLLFPGQARYPIVRCIPEIHDHLIYRFSLRQHNSTSVLRDWLGLAHIPKVALDVEDLLLAVIQECRLWHFVRELEPQTRWSDLVAEYSLQRVDQLTATVQLSTVEVSPIDWSDSGVNRFIAVITAGLDNALKNGKRTRDTIFPISVKVKSEQQGRAIVVEIRNSIQQSSSDGVDSQFSQRKSAARKFGTPTVLRRELGRFWPKGYLSHFDLDNADSGIWLTSLVFPDTLATTLSSRYGGSPQ